MTRRFSVPAIAVLVAALACLAAVPALASSAPHWLVMSSPAPTYFHRSSRAIYELVAIDDGSADTSGEIVLTDVLPKGLTVVSATGYAEVGEGEHPANLNCAESASAGVVTVTCTTTAAVPVGELLGAKIVVSVPSGIFGPLLDTVTVSGGGAAQPASDSVSTPVVPASETAPYGVQMLSGLVGTDGTAAAQAGSHPFSYTTLLSFPAAADDTTASCKPVIGSNAGASNGCPTPAGSPRNIEVTLPPGLLGNPTAVPRCSQREFLGNGFSNCPAATQVGTLQLGFYSPLAQSEFVPVYDVEPPPGQPAELGFTIATAAHTAMFFHVRPGGGYGLVSSTAQIDQFLGVRSLALTIWGVPADPLHTPLRISTAPGQDCPSAEGSLTGGCVSHAAPAPFLTMPTACTGSPLSILLGTDSWEDPQPSPLATSASAQLPATTGCEALSFREPSLAVQPSSPQAGAPAGYDVHLHVPQSEEPEGLATPTVRDVEVTLPEGTTLSPSAANGLLACTESQFQLNGESPGECPAASLIGTARILSPLLEEPIHGRLYVAAPECSVCAPGDAAEGRLLRLYLEAQGPEVLVKLAGHTEVDQATGRLKAVFAEDPQLPFSDLEVSLEGGPLAPLANPAACGPAAASARLTAWSGQVANLASPATTIEGCSPQPFAPSLTAGTTASAEAGAFSPFSLAISRPDGQADLGSIAVHTPPGLLGDLATVTPCGEAAADAGTCGPESLLGESTATVGPGSSPYTVTGGKVYLTGPYGGGPYGLSIVTPAKAGPFTLAGNTGNGTEVVRASIHVDPYTTALTIATDPLPTQLDGIPLRIDRVTVDVNRPHFMLNPTNCDPMSIGATVTGAGGRSAEVGEPFQVTGCAGLKFKPHLKVALKGGTKRAGHPALTAWLRMPEGGANIARAQVALPHTELLDQGNLDKVCKQAEIASASCPKRSVYGWAKAWSPLLAEPLEGPVFLGVGYGHKLPDLVAELNGQIRVLLHGRVDTDKADGIRNTFEVVPDAPVSRFMLHLKGGRKYGLIENEKSLCEHPRRANARFVGQNGVVDVFRPKIATSCKKHKKRHHKQRHVHKGSGKHRG